MKILHDFNLPALLIIGVVSIVFGILVIFWTAWTGFSHQLSDNQILVYATFLRMPSLVYLGIGSSLLCLLFFRGKLTKNIDTTPRFSIDYAVLTLCRLTITNGFMIVFFCIGALLSYTGMRFVQGIDSTVTTDNITIVLLAALCCTTMFFLIYTFYLSNRYKDLMGAAAVGMMVVSALFMANLLAPRQPIINALLAISIMSMLVYSFFCFTRKMPETLKCD